MHVVTNLCRQKIHFAKKLFSRRCTSGFSQKDESYVTRHFEEISISVPWGHINGKWYGPNNVRPILGLHGWQDNAGTFDTLAPLLPQHVGFLALDLPGHGRSSWLPSGMSYHSIDLVSTLLRIMDFFKWDKVSMICHSMSSVNGFVFSAFYPEKVDMMVGLDVLKPLSRNSVKIVDNYKECLIKTIAYEKRHSKSEPPCYEWDKLVDRLHYGSNKSVKKESCKYLLNRAIQPCKSDPKKYYFARDSRLKQSMYYGFSKGVALEMAQRISSPYMFIKASQGPYYEERKYFDEALDIMKRNPLFEYYEVEGSHHVHLNNPETVSPIINSFINKWRPL
ncbi:probable serine hydrolase [Ceratitis capitata]|uniref:(Mediterranean fruit fly) hypothetical protein n=1 Tax=Ceratitis capitata TaxID=7213 RepID=A0A811V0I2_CERCA|nr:probable serine hydrolase [Ceratitis capitata]CAD7003397.1 unnamed protein product [Ceratitis capitata]